MKKTLMIFALSIGMIAVANANASLIEDIKISGFKCENNECVSTIDGANVSYKFKDDGVVVYVKSKIQKSTAFAQYSLNANYCYTAFKSFLGAKDAKTAFQMALIRLNDNSSYLDDNYILYSKRFDSYMVSIGGGVINNEAQVLCYINKLK